jgi:hypothetical protein
MAKYQRMSIGFVAQPETAPTTTALGQKELSLNRGPNRALLLQIHQERLGSTAAADRRRSAAHQGNVVQGDDFVVSRSVYDWTQRLSGNQSNYSAAQQLQFSSCIGGHFAEP